LGSVIERAGGITEFGAKRRVSLLRGGHGITCDLTTATGRDTPVSIDDVIDVPEVMVFGK
jgi:hypothetical protein